ncbi:glutathione S-transferase [Bordetella pertussis]|uniref:Glutathione S-transferase n=1 Tax=Bordetella pertussis (strain ATCC 9797 / DSM 5571 / CCUG 30873 / LMG 14455 / NCTC 10739 / 18323) TaxID=568706 RepID=A0A0T7CNH4_BORP1|nr:glutathione S-transferase [Bordetella pertussis]AZR84863.1 glutathione S-transferase [Bordetella pertussis]PNO97725.1 glutathione S-transferase [Bordetella pertussis 18323]UEB58819.1 glutathione S-transferase [Bordetella pertussis]CCJ63198.1 putative glutathione S-transferase [Bordetella pertussis 18323]CFP47944.1 glutathione S-transferase [Bordetella pertussis]
MSTYELIGSRGCGSAIVEMALALANVPYTLTDLPYLKPGPGRDRLLSLNVTGQVPTLVLPDGEVMTESAAIVMHLHDVAPAAGLAPPPGSAERARFWNTLVRLVAGVYATFTYGDDPAKWTLPGDAAELLRTRVHDRRAQLWQEIERGAGAPHVLGRRFSALDLYVVVMTRWRPGPPWFQSVCPRLAAAARRAAEESNVAQVLRRHFDPPLE